MQYHVNDTNQSVTDKYLAYIFPGASFLMPMNAGEPEILLKDTN